MKCLICKKEFITTRNLTTLFSTKRFLICDKCLQKNPFELEFNVVPLDNHSLEIISLFRNEKYINYNAFIDEESQIYEKLLQTKKRHQFLFYDSFILNEKNLYEINAISNNLDKDIFIITSIYKIEK